jgi:hypothetical protein
MNKLKKTISDLREYLGKDSRGLSLLDEVSKAAHSQRHELSLTKERCGSLELTIELRNNQMLSHESRIQSLTQELASARALLAQSRRELTNIKEETAELRLSLEAANPDWPAPVLDEESQSQFTPWSTARVADPGEFSKVFNTLKRELPKAPQPSNVSNFKLNGRLTIYELTDVCKSLSPSELLKLGRFVACMAMINFPAGIAASNNLATAHNGMKCSDNQLGKFIRWFHPNNVKTSKYELPKLPDSAAIR